jgi:hypothetical protein
MAVIPLIEKAILLRTDRGEVVRASRPYVWLECFIQAGERFQWLAQVDSGAPFSVLPYTLWSENQLAWHSLGDTLFRGDQPLPGSLIWQGVACRFGEMAVRLLDPTTATRSGPLLLAGKFALAAVPSFVEREPLLGQNFWIDNSLTLTLKGIAGAMTGQLAE